MQFRRPQLRDATIDDLDQILAIERLCFPTPWTEQHYRDEIAHSNRWTSVAVETSSGNIAALSVCWLVADEVQLLKLATHPLHRRQEHAKRLLERIITRAKQEHVSEILLEVGDTNASALALYRSFSFVMCGRRRAYYGAGEDALLLSRSP